MNTTKRNLTFLAIIVCITTSILFIAFTTHPEKVPSSSLMSTNSIIVTDSDEFSFAIGESHSFSNLQLFYLTTDKNIIDKSYITLEEAMEEKYIVVFETENVNQLAVENISNHFIFICSGEIVKGGKQDRTIGKDIILPPKSGKVPLASFCVESGRWNQREHEILDEFSSSHYSLSSRDLKVAAKKSKSQREVWKNVSKQQDKVNESMVVNYDYDVAFDVKDEVSETSLQLTLENKELRKVKTGYEKFFKNLDFDSTRTVGFVYAINGEIYGIDIYYNYKLFNDLWLKLLDAVIVEAIGEKTGEESKSIIKQDIVSMLTSFSNSKIEVNKEEINSETTYIITSTDEIVKFETFDKRENNMLLHLNYITVDTITVVR